MNIRFFAVPAHGDQRVEAELNACLTQNRVRDVDRRFVDAGRDSYWAICVTCIESDSSLRPPKTVKRAQIDYREVLSETEFVVYAKLRDVRKSLAARDGVPAYQVMSNEQLASLVTKRGTTREGLVAIPGIGERRASKYGAPLLAVLSEHIPEIRGGACDEPGS